VSSGPPQRFDTNWRQDWPGTEICAPSFAGQNFSPFFALTLGVGEAVADLGSEFPRSRERGPVRREARRWGAEFAKPTVWDTRGTLLTSRCAVLAQFPKPDIKRPQARKSLIRNRLCAAPALAQ